MFLAAFTSALQAKRQAVHTKRAWLSRDFASTCPHAEQRWLLNAGLTSPTRLDALFSSRRTSNPQPEARMPRFNPAFCRTLRPGALRVPRAERVMFWIFRFSTRMKSNRRAKSVLVFSTQSLRRSLSRAFSRAMPSLTRLRRFEPLRARASLRFIRSSLVRSRSVREGMRSSSPVDRAAAITTPRSTPTTLPLPGAGIGSGTAANATCQRPARSMVTRYDFTPGGTARDQRNRTHPIFGTRTSPTARSSPEVLLSEHLWEAGGTGTYEHTSDYPRHFEEVKRRVPWPERPGFKAPR